MIHFSILKKSKKSRARLGLLETPHGVVETPAFVGVATQATVKAMTMDQVRSTGMQLLIANTYHLHIRPGEDVVKKGGGLHKFMDWDRPLMTDSGGFQVFSLGFGKDRGTGKILKEKSDEKIREGEQPRTVRITEDGVEFRSYVDGRKLFIGPRESMRIQEKLGADIIFNFDECTSPIADHAYTKKSLDKTHRWARVCIDSKKSKQALYGVVQGGKFKDLRIESAEFMNKLPFAGFGIGGEFGDDKRQMTKMIDWVVSELDEARPRHLLGIGYLEDMPKIIASGIDTFDCIVPTHYARRGVAFTSRGRLDIGRTEFLSDKKPLDPKCSCFVCQNHTRSYLSHLLRAHEITPLTLLSFHNMHYFNAYVSMLREDIKKGNL
ncbi:MAG: hypothetical protein A3C84_04485 [Candidatus Ryanbacteria bacterium RIFCSPHIGHO2_02_FULL_48_12]|uniref:Queuine tRNA-ribosyltransferase n=1 Tax=Candidatus Ryanbacteria bacterium RIFCSPHIGHO2_01_FULL_48_27 TaxID=1802115 RepID=A0A1G2G646_9BACT|nr:MAG: hypothetical protein A2756_02315 [Candidatus Ryanbacteria bacterium RIFCSPHIGHO2_01_FULL_48_27]OGZ49837.1 MAG: hypothetical protein A3C84_04485 [Candidatus Ryanbacteria bacterium RIFCSPHIGHO2_02_FULL_48_12]